MRPCRRIPGATSSPPYPSSLIEPHGGTRRCRTRVEGHCRSSRYCHEPRRGLFSRGTTSPSHARPERYREVPPTGHKTHSKVFTGHHLDFQGPLGHSLSRGAADCATSDRRPAYDGNSSWRESVPPCDRWAPSGGNTDGAVRHEEDLACVAGCWHGCPEPKLRPACFGFFLPGRAFGVPLAPGSRP